MTSRERVLAAIEHREPDGLPVDMGATPSSGISAIAYYNLKKHLGMNGPTLVYDVVQQVAQPEDAILDRFGIDAVDIGRTFNDRPEDWYDFSLPQGMTVQFPTWFHPRQQADEGWDVVDKEGTRIAYMPYGATFFDQTCFPYLDGYPADFKATAHTGWEKYTGPGWLHSPWDHAGEPDFWQQLAAARPRPAPVIRPRPGDRCGLQPVRVGHLPAPHG